MVYIFRRKNILGMPSADTQMIRPDSRLLEAALTLALAGSVKASPRNKTTIEQPALGRVQPAQTLARGGSTNAVWSRALVQIRHLHPI
jgi:hypothetical protein